MNALHECAAHCVPILVAAGASLDAIDSVRLLSATQFFLHTSSA